MKLLLPLFTLLLPLIASAQVKPVLHTIYNNMAKARTVQYSQQTEKFYRNNNYHAADTCFFYLQPTLGIVPKHQVNIAATNLTYVYNGKQSFLLNSNTHSMDIDPARDSASRYTYSFWRQSWANLFQMLPAILHDSVQKSITTEARFYHVYFNFPRKRLAALHGFTDLGTDSIQWNYEIVIDKKNMLPVAFNVSIQSPSGKEDFIRVKWANLQINGPSPKEESWFSSTYREQFPNQTAPRNPWISKGTQMPGWKLPLLSAADSLNSADLQGKLTLLYFWQKNCGICMAAFPMVAELQSKFAGKNFQLISINCYDLKEEVNFFHRKYSPSYTMCYGGTRLAELLGFYGFPMAVLVDPNGIVQDVAPFSRTGLETKISAQLQPASR